MNVRTVEITVIKFLPNKFTCYWFRYFYIYNDFINPVEIKQSNTIVNDTKKKSQHWNTCVKCISHCFRTLLPLIVVNRIRDPHLKILLSIYLRRKSSSGLFTPLQTKTRINISNDFALLPNLCSQTSHTSFLISYKNSAPVPGGNAPNSKRNSGIISRQPCFDVNLCWNTVMTPAKASPEPRFLLSLSFFLSIFFWFSNRNIQFKGVVWL